MASPELMARELATGVFGDLDGVGLDLVDVQVLADLIADGGQVFLDACWTPTEQADAHRDPERLAGRWAAKEAVMKCLGKGIGDIEPTDIEILTLPSGAPTVSLRAQAAAIAHTHQLGGWLVSITHENRWAAAIAVAHRQTRPPSSNPALEGPNGVGRHV
jgi:holo-[acyl-carrier protein] synthase